MPNTIINLQNINICYNNKCILHKLSLDIYKNDFISIIGANGVGKSTLIKCILGLIKPNIGLVKKEENLTIGYVPQNFHIENTLPIKVKYFLSLKHKLSKSELLKVTNETGINHLLDRQLYNLSGGERQRVLLTHALVNNPKILILDEPTNSLDLAEKHRFYNLIKTIHSKRGIAIVMISHDLLNIFNLNGRILFLTNTSYYIDTPLNIKSNNEFKQLFGEYHNLQIKE